MSNLYVRLFGKLHVQCGEQATIDFSVRKVQELFCYLLLYRDHSHTREALATLLWGDNTTAQSKKYLRHALWQLQTTLRPTTDHSLLLFESDWIQFDPEADLWLDVAVLEQAFSLAQGIPGRQLDIQQAQTLQTAIEIYRGDLLEGWCQDWCLFERERLQNLYLTMLDKLIDYCEVHHNYETGLSYGMRIMHCDRARERTHRQMMRLHYLARDRTAALRQYERCVAALDEELEIKPSKRTVALYEQIRADRPLLPTPTPTERDVPTATPNAALRELLGHIEQLQGMLDVTHHQLQRDLQTIEVASPDQR